MVEEKSALCVGGVEDGRDIAHRPNPEVLLSERKKIDDGKWRYDSDATNTLQ